MQTIQVLIVDGSAEHRRSLSQALTDAASAVQVMSAKSLKSFLRAVRYQNFDCVVLDYQLLEGMSDPLWERAKKKLGQTPVLVVSEQKTQGVVVRAMRSGSADFLQMDDALRGGVLWERVRCAVEASWHRRRLRQHAERRHRWLARMAHTDSLSGLRNRHYLYRALEAGRWSHDRRGLGSVLIDLDHFKQINDTFGHSTGDRVIQHVAGLLRAGWEEYGTIVRWGGEEFLVLLESSDEVQTWLAAERVRWQVQTQALPMKDGRLSITCSVGVVHSPGGTFSQAAIDLTDRALYLAKECGRNRVCTGQMARIYQIIQDLHARGITDLQEQRRQLLLRAWPTLSATQRRYLTEHCERVRSVAVEIAQRLGERRVDSQSVGVAGLFHDCGKIFIPEELLSKPTALTTPEWELMYQQSELGARLGAWIGLDGKVCQIIRNHHTHDHRLHGDSNLEAHVLGAADAIVAMRTDRAYCPARSPNEVRMELQREAGKQFHPEVVMAALAVGLENLPMAA